MRVTYRSRHGAISRRAASAGSRLVSRWYGLKSKAGGYPSILTCRLNDPSRAGRSSSSWPDGLGTRSAFRPAMPARLRHDIVALQRRISTSRRIRAGFRCRTLFQLHADPGNDGSTGTGLRGKSTVEGRTETPARLASFRFLTFS